MNVSNVNLNNKISILKLLCNQETVFRAEMARETNLSLPTVQRIIDDLLSKNVVQIQEVGVSSGGRPPLMLKLNKDIYHIVSVDIDEYRTKVLLTDLKLNIIDQLIVDNIQTDTAQSILVRAVNMVKTVLTKNKEDIRTIAGIGICIPGLVDAKNGYVIYSNELNWSGINAIYFFKEEFDCLIIVEESSRAFARYEKLFGAGLRYDNYMCLSLGDGISSSLVIKGKAIYGASEVAGQLGHMAVEREGRRCSCGNYGCLDLYASGNAIEKKAKEIVRNNEDSLITDLAYGDANKVDLFVVFEAAKSGDRCALDILELAAEYLGMAVTGMINLVDPQAIICGGKMSDSQLFMDMFKEVLKKRHMSMLGRKVEIIQVKDLGNYKAIGAAGFILNFFIKNGGEMSC